MHAEKLCWNGAKHSCELLPIHCSMRAEGRQDRLEPVAEILPGVAGQVVGARMHAALIRWHNENPVAFSKLRKTLHEQIVQLLLRQIAFSTARGAIQTHAMISTCIEGCWPMLDIAPQ